MACRDGDRVSNGSAEGVAMNAEARRGDRQSQIVKLTDTTSPYATPTSQEGDHNGGHAERTQGEPSAQ